MKSLPILLSIPHGGSEIPQELKGLICLNSNDLFDDSDAYTREIYNLETSVTEVISTNIARAFVDLNRAPDNLPPRNPDGVIKSHTCYGKVIYPIGAGPDKALTKKLLNNYYYPYHQQIQAVLNDKSKPVELALDCHSMASVAPAISPDKGKTRPVICLGNAHGKSCPQEITEKLAACFRRTFSLNTDEVTINRPFSGGYITRKYGRHPIPWIQVEMNRALYLEAPFFNRSTLSVQMIRILELQKQFEEALQMFFQK